jgi:hypothetical protein
MPAMALVAIVVFAFDGLPERLSPLQAKQLAVMNDEARHPSRCMTLNERWIDPAKPCHFGAAPKTLLWGDSHAMVTATSLEASGVPFFFAADADCPIGKGLSISPEFERGLVTQGHYRRCGEYNHRMLARAMRPDIRTVVLSSRWTNWRIGEPANPAESAVDVRLVDDEGASASPRENLAKFENAFTALVTQLTRAGKRVVIVGPVPEPTFNVPHQLYVEGFGFAPEGKQAADYQSRHRTILAFFQRFKAVPGVIMIWPAEALCRTTCYTAQNGVPIYLDHNHLTFNQATHLAPLYKHLRT